MWLLMMLRRLLSVPYLMRHPAVPRRLKVLPYLAFIYFIFPRDLFFDFRVFGLFDDVFVVSLLLGIFVSRATKHVLEDGQRRSGSIEADFKVLVEEERARARGEEPPPRHRRAVDDVSPEPDDTPKDDLRSRE